MLHGHTRKLQSRRRLFSGVLARTGLRGAELFQSKFTPDPITRPTKDRSIWHFNDASAWLPLFTGLGIVVGSAQLCVCVRVRERASRVFTQILATHAAATGGDGRVARWRGQHSLMMIEGLLGEQLKGSSKNCHLFVLSYMFYYLCI